MAASTQGRLGVNRASSRHPAEASVGRAYPAILLWFGAEPQNVSVEILHLHLIGPGVIRREMTDFRSTASLLQQSVRVPDADPNPVARMSLVASAQEGLTFSA
jgi:hypothetical protein